MAKHRRTHPLARRLRIAAVATTAGALALVGVTTAGEASAQPLQLPAGLLPAGIPAPVIDVPAGPAADWAAGLFGSVNPGSAAPYAARTVQPVSGTLSSGYGARWGTHHGGLDIAAPIGTPIHAAADGEVVSAGPASGFGQWVRVRHDDGTVTVYGHVDTYLVGVGQRVVSGQQIATVGNRGQSTGPHLHFEAWDAAGARLNPNAWLADRGVTPTWGS